MDQGIIRKTSEILGLRYWSFQRDSKTLSISQINYRSNEEEIVTTHLSEHPFLSSVPTQYHEELFFLLETPPHEHKGEFYFEFELLESDKANWVLLVGQIESSTGDTAGIILPNHTRKQDDLEKQALAKAVKNLILQAEMRKREQGESDYTRKLARREADLISQTLQASENAQKIDKIINSLGSKKLDQYKLAKTLRSNQTSEINWEEFKTYFNEIHPEFVQELWSKNQGLTEREVKVCTLVRLGLQTKDISALTKLTPKTIEIYRYRIRKTLGLSRSENLMKVLSSYTW